MKRKKISLLLWIILVFFILFILFELLSFSKGIQKRITNPLLQKFSFLSHKIDNLRSFFRSKDELLKENKGLREKVNDLLIENSQLKIYREENKSLREALNFFLKQRYNFVLANVIGQIKEAPSAQIGLIIDLGEKDGIKPGYPVVFSKSILQNDEKESQGFLIGKVIKVNPYSSFVRLITDYQSVFAGTVLNEKENVDCLVQGVHGFYLSLSLIPVDKEVKRGDIVVTSGKERYIPKGLIIGEIEDVEIKSGELFQDVLARPLIPFKEINLVAVLKPKNEDK